MSLQDDFTNETVSTDVHAAHHNAIAQVLNAHDEILSLLSNGLIAIAPGGQAWQLGVTNEGTTVWTEYGGDPNANDMLADAMVLDLGTLPLVVQGNNANATTETDEVGPYRVAAGRASLWYTWTAVDGSDVMLTLSGTPDLDTVMAVYTATTTPPASFADLVAVVADDESGEGTWSRVHLIQATGTQYWLQMGMYSSSGIGGPFTLTADLYTAELANDVLDQSSP